LSFVLAEANNRAASAATALNRLGRMMLDLDGGQRMRTDHRGVVGRFEEFDEEIGSVDGAVAEDG
jgi:hypothetical protein